MCMISRKLSQSNINENKCRFSTLKKGFNLSVKVNNNLKKDYFPNLKIIVNKKSNCFQDNNDMSFTNIFTNSKTDSILINSKIKDTSHKNIIKNNILLKSSRIFGIYKSKKIFYLRNKFIASIPRKFYIFILRILKGNISNSMKKKKSRKYKQENYKEIVTMEKKNLNTKHDIKNSHVNDVSFFEEDNLTNSSTESYADVDFIESTSTKNNKNNNFEDNSITNNENSLDDKWINSNYMLNLTSLSYWISTKYNEANKSQPYILNLQGHIERDRNDIKEMLEASSDESTTDLSTISSIDSCRLLNQKSTKIFKVEHNKLNKPQHLKNTRIDNCMEKVSNQKNIDIDFFDKINNKWNFNDESTLLASACYKFKNLELPTSRLEYIKTISEILARRTENNKIKINEYAFKILVKQLNNLILTDYRIKNKLLKKDFGKRLKNMWSAKCFKKIFFSNYETLLVLPSKYIRNILKSMTKSERKALKYYKNVMKKKFKNVNRYLKLSINLYNTYITIHKEKPIEEMICDGFYKCLGIKRQHNIAGFYELRKDQFSKIIVSIVSHQFLSFLPLRRCDFQKFIKSKKIDNMIIKINDDLTKFFSKFINCDSIPEIIATFNIRLISCLNNFLLSNQILNEDTIIREILRRSNIILKVNRLPFTPKKNFSPSSIKKRKALLLKKGYYAYKKYKELKQTLKRPVQIFCNVLPDNEEYGKDSWLDSEKHGKNISNINSQKSFELKDQKIFEKIDSSFSTLSYSSRSTMISSDTNSQGIRYLNDGEFIINPERSIYSVCYKRDECKKNCNSNHYDKLEGQLYSVAIDECDKSVIERNSYTLFRPVYINGVEAGYSMQSKKGDVLCVRGITITLNYFISRGHQVQAFLPSIYKHHPDRCDNYDELLSLYEMNLIEFTQEYGADKYVEVNCQILQRAIEFGGCIVARSQMHVIVDERSIFSKVVEERLLMPTFCDEDIFFPLDGPLGRLGNSFNDTLLCRKYEEDWDRVRLQQLPFRDQKIWLFALAYLLESDKWFRQAEFLEGYYAKPLTLPPANVSSYLLNSAKYYQPHPPETCTKSNRGYRLVKLQKKSSNDYRLVRNRIVATDICLEEHHKLIQNEVIEFMNDPFIKKLFKQKILDKIPLHIFSELKGFRLFKKTKEKKLPSQEEQRLRSSYVFHDGEKKSKTGDSIMGSIDMVEYNWNYLHEYKHLLNLNN
ncbi:Ribonuclease Zc3h12a-like domain-containing protein [Strongyloides ratti]|uniref:Ribonuclease Zc3h12a-like domain-containing protein n=1 Tax=Strongyloides ratti TaxID=34506 RepID=A0A090LGU2_STRRB|nr:Ribonuclease Zc3h12a-like domain-containing protein [Strongyloides ratti]CEF69021.1 Ribonuclease Zc3h12a-like domain-containing protein [Strongyloides ratti]